MPIQLQGNGGTVSEVDGTTFRAVRMTQRPPDHGALGQYKVSTVTGAIAAGAAADSEIFQFRWTDATRLAVVTLVQMDFLYATTGFAAGLGTLRLTTARSFSVAGTGGGTLTLTGNNNKMRASMGSSLVGEVRVATTAALGAGTKTFDANDLGQSRFAVPVTTNANLIDAKPLSLFNPDASEHPLVLVANEGFAVRATVPATGVWLAGITCRWAEVTAY